MTADLEKGSTGLTDEEAAKRLEQVGPNRITMPRRVSFWGIAREEITEPMIILLLVVGFFYSLWGRFEDALTIFVVIILLVLAEVWNEYRAKKAVAALSKVAAPKTRVMRSGHREEIETENVVPGDILLLSPGTRVAADAELKVAYSIEVDESALTGESYPVRKNTGNMIYAGTVIVSGEGEAEVTETGMDTKIGRFSATAREIKEPKTPLQEAMKRLAFGLVWVALFFSILIPILGYLRGLPLKTMILTGLALAFAVIPEELPIIITMVLGLGAYQLSKKGFLVKTIRAAETLGEATVILTDKTGTITENKMTVVAVYPPDSSREVLLAAMNATTTITESPTDRAVIDKARASGLTSEGTIVREQSFNPLTDTIALLRQGAGGCRLFLKGAPESVLTMSEPPKDDLRGALERETLHGRRVIGVAQKDIPPKEEELPFDKLETSMHAVGIISIEDPPRPGVKKTIETAREAGLRTIMVTGDNPATAAFIAGEVGIPSKRVITGAEMSTMSDEKLRKELGEVSVFARTTPQDKYKLVEALKEDGEIVAVTGDGINDVLALKAADIGISMGIKGTDVAKEAADIVLANDDFMTIAGGIFEGRKFFDNLKKGLKYYLSVKTALVLVFLIPMLMSLPLPLAPIQIILLELFMDLAASAGFVAEPAERSIYEPERGRKLFDRGMLFGIGLSGLSLFAAVFGSYSMAVLQVRPLIVAQTFAFTAWIIGHVFLAFVSRSEKEPLYILGPFTNRVMNIWALLAFSFLLAALTVPSLGLRIHVTSIPAEQVLLIALICFVTVFWQEALKVIRYIQAHKPSRQGRHP